MASTPGTTEYEGPHDYLAMALEVLEATAHRAGWRKTPMTLYRLSEVGNFSTEDEDGTKEITAHYSISGIELAKEHPLKDLRTMAVILESPLAPLAMSLYTRDESSPPQAHALLGEIFFHADDEEYRQAHEKGRDILDMPGTKFARLIIGVIGDDYLVYRRIRGERPRWLPAEAQQDFGGPFALLSRVHRADIKAWRTVFGDRA